MLLWLLLPAYAMGEKELSNQHRVLAACSGYVAGTLAATPLDVIKTKLQQPGSSRNLLSVTADIFRRDGFPGGFYRGLGPALCMAPGTVIQYTLYDNFRARDFGAVASAIMAGVVDITVRTPMERIKTLRQAGLASAPVGTRAVTGARKIASLWSGYGATLLRDIPYCVIYWVSYDSFRKLFDVDGASRPAEKYQRGFFAGFMAGALAASAVTPADVIKTRIQISPPGMTPLSALSLLVRRDGVFALFAGLSTRLVRIPIYTGIVLATFEVAKATLAVEQAEAAQAN